MNEKGNDGKGVIRERHIKCVRERESKGERRGSHLILVQRFTTAEELQHARRRREGRQLSV